MPFPLQNTNSNSTDVTSPTIYDTFLLLRDQASDRSARDGTDVHAFTYLIDLFEGPLTERPLKDELVSKALFSVRV